MDDFESPRARRLLGKKYAFTQELGCLSVKPATRSVQARIRDINSQIEKLERRLRSEAAKQLSVSFSREVLDKLGPRF